MKKKFYTQHGKKQVSIDELDLRGDGSVIPLGFINGRILSKQ